MVQIQKAARKNSAWVAIAGVALAACGDGSEHGDDATCAEFESTDPVVLDADVRLVAEGERQVQRELALDLFVADDSGVYWVDTTGALLAQRRGEADVVELLRDVVPSEGAASGQRVLGLAAGVDRLYIADGYFLA